MWILATLSDPTNDDIKTLGAIATTLGVLIALFEHRLERWWREPLLTLEYDDKQGPPHWDRVLVQPQDFFLRLRVRNAPRCRSAENVQVLVTQYEGGQLGLDTRPLEWSAQRLPPGGGAVTVLGIPPGVQRHVDLLQIKAAAGALHAHLCVVPTPWGSGHVVSARDHTLELTVTAKDVDAITYKLSLRYRGQADARLDPKPRLAAEPLKRQFRRWCKRRRHRAYR